MSDPVSNSEIEDVLASIRRLVSENAKALKRDGERDPEAEKLVLTPAFRIDESEAPAQVSDVFAVDTETWNDALGRVEQAENADIFSKETQAHDATSKAVAAPVEAAADTSFEGLAPLPAWVRRLERVERWITAKVIIYHARLLVRETAA